MRRKNRIGFLSHQLTKDPYNFAVAFERCLWYVAQGDWILARADIKTLTKLLRGSPGLACLNEIVDRRLTVEVGRRVFLITDGALSESTSQHVTEIQLQVAKDFNRRPPLALMDMRRSPYAMSFTERVSRHLSFIRVSTASNAALRHEFVHATLSTGFRLLDEGIADWYCASRSSRPNQDRCLFHELLPIGGLIAFLRGDDVHFESVATTPSLRVRLRGMARSLIADVHAAGGINEVSTLASHAYRLQNPTKIGEILEKSLGMPLGRWQYQSYEKDPMDTSDLRQKLLSCRFISDVGGLESCAQNALRAARCCLSWEPIDIAVCSSLIAMRIRIISGERPCFADISGCDVWTEEAKIRGMPATRKLALEGHRLCLIAAALSAASPFKAALAASRAETAFASALKSDPSDRDASMALENLWTHFRDCNNRLLQVSSLSATDFENVRDY